MSLSVALRGRARASVADAILDAAEAVALEAGLDGLAIAAVAARAGVAVGTLYNHFEDREAIIAALFRARRAVIGPMITRAAAAAKALPFEARLRAFMRALLAGFATQRAFLRLSILADCKGSKLVPREGALAASLIGALEQILRSGARRGAFPASQVPIYARMLHGQLRCLFVWRLTDAPSLVGDGELIVHTFLRSLAAS